MADFSRSPIDLQNRYRCCCNSMSVKTGAIVLASIWFCFGCPTFVASFEIFHVVTVVPAYATLVISLIFSVLLIVGIQRSIPMLVLTGFLFVTILNVVLCLSLLVNIILTILAYADFGGGDGSDESSHVVTPLNATGDFRNWLFRGTIGVTPMDVIQLVIGIWLSVLSFRCYRLIRYEKLNNPTRFAPENQVMHEVSYACPAPPACQTPYPAAAFKPGFAASFEARTGNP